MKFAVASLMMGFRSGPQSHRFYACRKHVPELVAGKASDCFFLFKDVKPREENVEDMIECDLCREG